MEEPALVHDTIRIFEELHMKYKNIGICLQAYLPRTDEDIENLLSRNARIRIVKGVYLSEDVIHNKTAIREKMLKFSIMLLKNKGNHAIATHDEEVIKLIKQMAQTYSIDKNSFEFQFLYGRKKHLQKKLVEEGYRVNVYLPYGKAWINYYLRRLGERF
jgi:proline dehydrogenase